MTQTTQTTRPHTTHPTPPLSRARSTTIYFACAVAMGFLAMFIPVLFGTH